MYNYRLTGIKAFLLALVLVFLAVLPAAFAAEEKALTIIHINDRHGRMDADPYLFQMAEDLRAQGENVLILDAGDTVHGQTTANLSQGEAMVDLANAVGYNAMAPGNHDFNFGVDRLLELSDMMNFPILAANLKSPEGELLFEDYRIFELTGLKVGIFGLATPETATKADPRLVAGLIFEDPKSTASVMVEALEAKDCDIIIALTHLGIDQASAPANRSDILAEVPGIDLIIDGHSHTLLENGQEAGNALLVQAGAFASHFGVVKVKLADGMLTKTAHVVAMPESGSDTDLAANEKIVAKITELNAEVEPITGEVVGYTPVLLQGEREYVRTGETNLANLITDSMCYATGADVAFLTGGNIRASIEAGDITMGEVLTTLPFSNLLVTVELSGADLWKALEHGVSKYPEAAGLQIQVSGLKFEFDPQAEPMHRVTKAIMADGSALSADRTYQVATIEFIVEGGDGYDMMPQGKNRIYYKGDVEAMAEYLGTNPNISAEPEHRVSALSPQAATKPAAVPINTAEPVSALQPYIVKPGDTLEGIAHIYGTTWRELQRINNIKDPDMIYPEQSISLPVDLPKAS